MAIPEITGKAEREPDDLLYLRTGCQWCTVCAMLVRGRANEILKAQPGELDDGEALYVAAHEEGAMLNEAVTQGIPALVGPQPFGSGMVNAMVPVCWIHAVGISVSSRGVLPASPQEAAMFGQKVPSLGQRREPGRPQG